MEGRIYDLGDLARELAETLEKIKVEELAMRRVSAALVLSDAALAKARAAGIIK